MKYVKNQLHEKLTFALAQSPTQSVYVLELNGADAGSVLEASVKMGANGVPAFDPTDLLVLGTGTVIRTLFNEETGLSIASEPVDIDITTAGKVTHIVVGTTFPLVLEAADLKMLRGDTVEVGSVLSLPRTAIDLEGI